MLTVGGFVCEICAGRLPMFLQHLVFPRLLPENQPPVSAGACSYVLILFQIMLRIFLLYTKTLLKDSNLLCSFIKDKVCKIHPPPQIYGFLPFNLNSHLHNCLDHCYISSAHSTFWCCQGTG